LNEKGNLSKPVIIVGGGPIGLIAALGLTHYGVPVLVLEADSVLSVETKAGTILTRTLEVLDRYGAVEPVLNASVRIDEIGETDLSSDVPQKSILTSFIVEETRFPFLINIPQHALEPVLRDSLEVTGSQVLCKIPMASRSTSKHQKV
jgi:3-(3-hydroxy-phenyl)propionate hydroxylase